MCVFPTAAKSDQKQIRGYNSSVFSEFFTPGPAKAGLKETRADGRVAEKSQPFCYRATVTETWKCHCSLEEQVYSAGNST